MISAYSFSHINSFDSFTSIELILYSIIFLSLGSFASSLVFRLSPNKSNNINILFPRSFCPNCKNTLKILHLIPLVGYLVQKGRCQKCNKKISIFYLFSEILFLLTGMVIIFLYGKTVISFYLFFILFLFYILFFLDLRFYYLPFAINIMLLLVGLSSNYFFNIFIDESTYLLSIPKGLFGFYGLVFGYCSLWLTNFIFKLFSKKDGIGGGDFILFGAIGSIFGPISLPIILFIGSMFGCLMYLFSKNIFKNKIPLGSCLILASISYFLLKNLNFLIFY